MGVIAMPIKQIYLNKHNMCCYLTCLRGSVLIHSHANGFDIFYDSINDINIWQTSSLYMYMFFIINVYVNFAFLFFTDEKFI